MHELRELLTIEVQYNKHSRYDPVQFGGKYFSHAGSIVSFRPITSELSKVRFLVGTAGISLSTANNKPFVNLRMRLHIML